MTRALALILMLLCLAPIAQAQDDAAAPAETTTPDAAPETTVAPDEAGGDVELPPVAPETPPADETPDVDESAAPKGPAIVMGGPVKARADAAVRESREGFTVLQLTGRVEISRGASRLDADRAVVWIDEARSAESKAVIMDVYAEGNVSTSEEGVRTKVPQAFFRWGASALTVDDTDGFIEIAKEPLAGELIARAAAARGAGLAAPGAVALAPKAGPPAGIIEPGRLGLIYGQQQEGPDITSRVEDNWRVTVLTRYPDIVLKDPSNPDGQMEILAENMVIWVNETKVREGKPLDAAELQVYAEGNVVIYQGARTIECAQMYYDFKTERGLLIGGPGGRTSIKAWSEVRKMPFYYRAAEFRQVAADQYQAKDGILSTCEFPTPDWGIRSRKMTITVGTEAFADENGETLERPVERAVADGTTLELAGFPVFYWPHFSRDLKNDKTALKNIRFLSSSQFGFSVLTQWDLYDFGFGENDWSSATLLADYYSKRGIGLGLDFLYRRPAYYGDLFVYGINDSGTDVNDLPPPDENRERIRWRNRWFINDNWRLDAELSYISDSQFLNEYWEDEQKQEKEQESYAYLRYLKDDRTFAALLRPRLNDFQTQNEYLPEARYAIIGEPLGPFTWITDTRLSNIRRNYRDDLQETGVLPPDYRSWRFVTEHELQLPLTLGFVRVAPFVNAAYSLYEKVISGDRNQTALSAGFRSSATFWRVYDVYSRLLDVNRIRHVVTPTLDVYSTVSTQKSPAELYQFDAYDAVEEGSVVHLGLRQRWQTQRLSRKVQPATVGGWRNVNWMLLDLDIDYYTNSLPEFGDPTRHWGPLEAKYQWQITDRLALLARTDLRVDSGLDLETADFGFLIDRSPRAVFYVGDSYIAASQSNLLTVSASYKIDERWTFTGFGQWDTARSRSSNYRVGLQRRLHCWIMELGAEFDAGRENRTYTLMFWPVGVPEAKLRFF